MAGGAFITCGSNEKLQYLCFGMCQGMRLCSVCIIAGLKLMSSSDLMCGSETEDNAFTYAALAAFMNIQFSGFLRKGHYLPD